MIEFYFYIYHLMEVSTILPKLWEETYAGMNNINFCE
jgi:hypothetical protein